MKLEPLLAEPRGWCWGCGRVTTERAVLIDPEDPATALVFVCGECRAKDAPRTRHAPVAGNVDA